MASPQSDNVTIINFATDKVIALVGVGKTPWIFDADSGCDISV